MNKKMSGYVYDYRGIKKKKNGYFSYDKYPKAMNFFFSFNPLGDLVLKTVIGRQTVKNLSCQREKDLNDIYIKMCRESGKMGFVRYDRCANGNPYQFIEFKTERPYKLGYEPVFQINPGIIYLDNKEFVEMDEELLEKYNLYRVCSEGEELYDETFEPFNSYL